MTQKKQYAPLPKFNPHKKKAVVETLIDHLMKENEGKSLSELLDPLKDKVPVNDFSVEKLVEYAKTGNLTYSGTVTGKWSGGKPNFENIPKGTGKSKKSKANSAFIELTTPAGGVNVGDLLDLMGVGHVVVSEVTDAGGMNIIPVLSIGDVVVLENGQYGVVTQVDTSDPKLTYKVRTDDGDEHWHSWTEIEEHSHEISFDNLKGM